MPCVDSHRPDGREIPVSIVLTGEHYVVADAVETLIEGAAAETS